MERVQFIVILHTEMGNADVVSNFLDEVAYPEVAGTVAGADTIIVITRSEEDAEHFIERIENMIFKIESINRREFFLAELKALQNGSDIRGIALDTEEQTATLTATAVAEIAVGVVRWLQDKTAATKGTTAPDNCNRT